MAIRQQHSCEIVLRTRYKSYLTERCFALVPRRLAEHGYFPQSFPTVSMGWGASRQGNFQGNGDSSPLGIKLAEQQRKAHARPSMAIRCGGIEMVNQKSWHAAIMEIGGTNLVRAA